jgi:hypothetical protein
VCLTGSPLEPFVESEHFEGLEGLIYHEQEDAVHQQYIRKVEFERDEVIRTKTLETTELRRENNMLKNHIKTLELSAAPTSLGSMARDDPLRWYGLTMGGEETTRRPPALHIQACKLKKRMQRDTSNSRF